MSTAQYNYDRALRLLWQRLGPLGFTKVESFRKGRLTTSTHHLGFMFQKSRSSTKNHISWTLNLSRIPIKEWDQRTTFLTETHPFPGVHCGAQEVTRIGHLLGVGDIWWDAYDTTSPADLTRHMERLLVEDASDWLDQGKTS